MLITRAQTETSAQWAHSRAAADIAVAFSIDFCLFSSGRINARVHSGLKMGPLGLSPCEASDRQADVAQAETLKRKRKVLSSSIKGLIQQYKSRA